MPTANLYINKYGELAFKMPGAFWGRKNPVEVEIRFLGKYYNKTIKAIAKVGDKSFHIGEVKYGYPPGNTVRVHSMKIEEPFRNIGIGKILLGAVEAQHQGMSITVSGVNKKSGKVAKALGHRLIPTDHSPVIDTRRKLDDLDKWTLATYDKEEIRKKRRIRRRK
jgi:GNAT superfamily N-acetyltransferase